MIRLLALLVGVWFTLSASDRFAYPREKPLDIQVAATTQRSGCVVRDISYVGVAGRRIAAYVVEPSTPGPHPGILFVHWYEDGAPDSNRTQFLEEAVKLAAGGAESLLIETMWSKPNWYRSRKQADDFVNSVAQVKELRRALDVLLAQPGVDAKRIAYVGHDFGAMYGAVLAGVDHRPSAWVLIAGTTSFSEWYLYYPKLEGAERARFIRQLSPLDPTRSIGRASPAPVMFQFANHDRFVPVTKAQEFYSAARQPKEIHFYDCEHHMNEAAAADRVKWLSEKLGR